MRFDSEFLECQTCGVKLKYLSPAELQKVADNPYNYILFCSFCQKDEIAALDINFA